MSVDWRRHGALGDLRVLSDDIICRILGKVEVQDITRLACVSSVFYIFCNNEPLWMRLCMSEPPETAIVYEGTWRHSARKRLADRLKVTPPQPRPPRRFEGFSSLHLYRQWYRCHIDLRTFSFDAGHVDRISDASPTLFFHKYDGRRPVLLTDLLTSWPASQKWTLPQLVDRFGDVKFKVSQAHGRAVKMSLRNYAAYSSIQQDEEPLYIFDPNFGESAPPILSDYDVPLLFGEDLLALLSGGLRPPYRWFVLGPPRSGAAWHVDPSLTSAWNALLTGKKRWAFYPPGRVPPGVTLRINEDDGDIAFDGPPSLQWWLDVYPHIKPEDRPLECTQLPGETIFVPSGWWHCVLNIEDSIAVTQNFMNAANFEAVLCDLAPGFHHRGLARAGCLAQKRSGDPSSDHFLVPANTACQHFFDQGEDYISKQAVRELLIKMWDKQPELRNKFWECACKIVGADHWQTLLGLICARHGMRPPTRHESLPLSGGRSAVFRVGTRIVKLFISEMDSQEVEGRSSDASASNVEAQETGACSNGHHAVGNGAGAEEGFVRDCEGRCDAERPEERDRDRAQEEMYRTEVLLHKLIRTFESKLQDTVPAVLGHGVVVEKGNGDLVLERTASECSNAENDGQVGQGCSNGKRSESKRPNGTTGSSASAKGKKRRKRDTAVDDVIADVIADGVRRRWLYVVFEDCGGKPLAEVYDSLSKEGLLELALFLGCQVALIQALPLQIGGLMLESARTLDSAAEKSARIPQANAERRKHKNISHPETEGQRPGSVAQLTSCMSQQVPVCSIGCSAVGNDTAPSTSICKDPSTEKETNDNLEHAKPPSAAELPSLEELGVPTKWRPFAAFLRAQREDVTERLTDLGLQKPLVGSVEAYLPKDPVELVAFERDPVWLHTDLLPDNILVRPSAKVDEEGANIKQSPLIVDKIGNGDKELSRENAHAKETDRGRDCHSVQLKQRGAYTAAHILDFADARIGDPLYEIASLHVGTFRGDSQLLAAFLEAAPLHLETEPRPEASREQCDRASARERHALSYRAMCFTMLHEINLLQMLSEYWPSALADCLTWQQLSSTLWSVLDQELPKREYKVLRIQLE